jgi:hypothetical protein
MKLQATAFVLAVLLGACSGSSGSGDVCVADTRSPGKCQTTWTLVDSCPLLAPGQTIEAAVFPKACPDESTLSKGDTSTAIDTQNVAEDQPIAPVTGLVQDTYGFTFLVRDDACHVLAWGCTEADLSKITEIRTLVQNWTGQNVCDAASEGACATGETCHQGACQ